VSKRDLRAQLPPGPALPAALQMLATWTRPAASLQLLRRRYGKRITVQLPLQPPFVILSDPDEIKQLFTASPEAIHPGEGARILEPLIGRNSVILLDEAPHMEQRKLLLPAFHGEKMQRLTGLMTELSERELDSWPTGRPVALHPRLQGLTLEIILRAVFGLDQGERLDDLRATLTEVLEFSESPLSVMPWAQRYARLIPPLKRFQTVMTRVDELIFDQIAERRAAGEDDRDDVMAMLLQARHDDHSAMSPQEIRDELMTALVAGHETTASQLAWAFERLAREPRVTERLIAETEAAEGDAYLTATVHEILRLRPVLPNAEPRLTKVPVEIGGVTYPPGVCLLASAYLVHRDPEIYPDPSAFTPERFLGEAQPDDEGDGQAGEASAAAEASARLVAVRPGTYTWLPFGGGRRRCLGASFALQEMKIVIRAALARYALAPGGERPEQTARRSITFSPNRGATVILQPRARTLTTPAAALATAS
jgi:cytochrome P450